MTAAVSEGKTSPVLTSSELRFASAISSSSSLLLSGSCLLYTSTHAIKYPKNATHSEYEEIAKYNAFVPVSYTHLQAQRAAQQDPSFAVNVEALTAAQPKDLDASEIEVRLGAPWIDKEYIQQFMYEKMCIRDRP